MNTKPKNAIETLAIERIWRLFELAEQQFQKQPNRSHRYVALALKIATKNRARIPLELKAKYCKKCRYFLKNKANATITLHTGYQQITCHNCQATFKRKNP